MAQSRLKVFLISSSALLGLSLVLLLLWTVRLDQQIRQRLQKGWFLPPIEMYSAPETLRQGLKAERGVLQRKLLAAEMKELGPGASLRPGDFSFLDTETCLSRLSNTYYEDLQFCLYFIPRQSVEIDEVPQLVAVGANQRVLALFKGEDLSPADQLSLPPILFAQYYGGEPILRHILDLGQVPLQCLQSITAVEDEAFLEHSGVSVTGTLRAAFRNLTKGRWAEGGSTLTQQLVKNYFLSPEKTLRRKITEQFMSVLLELRVSKDEILQNYLNVIYLGQNGPFQVRGFSAASRHYFAKNIEDLNLSECALLAAIINSPGRYSPFTKQEAAEGRRRFVLKKMFDLGMISEEEEKRANETPLPKRPPVLLSDPAPYMVQAINRKVKELQLSEENGLKVFTTMNVDAQESAQKSLSHGISRLETQFKKVTELKAKGHMLQASMIAVDLKTAQILAMVGGREFKQTQFNRITDSFRQVGSIMKPLVFLTALESLTPDGKAYSPLTLLDDSPFTYRYQGQVWQPKNYDNKYVGPIPLFYALKESLNVPTARLATQIDLNSVVELSKRVGIESALEPLPSLSLGAFELRPWEVAQAYSTLGRMGSFLPIHFIRSITDLNGEVQFLSSHSAEQVLAPETAAVLVGMMKQALLSGTARSSKAWGFTRPAAGKTGTTSDSKDAWFAGFTPDILSIVWVGYDDNTPHGLTGASGALPIWLEFMKTYSDRYPERDFDWPQASVFHRLEHHELVDMLPNSDTHIPDSIELILRPSDQTFE